MFSRWKKHLGPATPYDSGSVNPFDYDPYADMPGIEITGPWHPKMAAHLKAADVRRVNLNAPKGFSCDDYEFLRELEHLEALTVPLREKQAGPVPLEALRNLKQLSSTLQALPSAVDLTRLPLLRSCKLTWSSAVRSLFDCEALERIYLSGLKAAETGALGALTNLKSLQLAHSSLTTLGPLSAHGNLERLDLIVARKLETIEAVGELSNLRCLYLAEAHKITSLEPLRNLKSLEALIIVDCGEIDSLSPLAELTNLKAVSFSGTKTVIQDGDLSPLTALPKLAMLMFGARRHYSHKLIKKWSWENFNQPDVLLKPA